ncbi:MAG TPA: DMT family transporter [Marisediminicola sp.]|nr:DMT family transporter [Marisediminicola sp.]
MSVRAAVPPLVLVAVIVTMLAWASAFIVIRGVMPHFSPGALALARLLVGSVLLGLLLVGRRWIHPTGREWLLVGGFGVAWFGAYNIALNAAEQTLDAGTTAMLVNIGPILIALGAAVFLREGISKWLAIGTGVAFFGVLLIWTSSGGVGLGDGGGVLWCLLAAISYAGGVLMQKPALRRLPARQVTWMGCVIGMIACLPFGGQLLADVQNAPAISVAGAIYLGAVPTALAFSTWAYALSKLPAAQLGVSTYVVPPLAILLGFLVFGEVPTVVAAIGGGVCLVGVALSRRRMRGSA